MRVGAIGILLVAAGEAYARQCDDDPTKKDPSVCLADAKEDVAKAEELERAGKSNEADFWWAIADNDRDRACNFGDGKTCYEQAHSGPRLEDAGHSAAVLARACWYGYVRACVEAGIEFKQGVPSRKDPFHPDRIVHGQEPIPELALMMFERGCALHDDDACALAKREKSKARTVEAR
jgi:hypothetical protein